MALGREDMTELSAEGRSHGPARKGEAAVLVADCFAALARERGPRYLVLHNTVTKLVHDGDLQPGEQLPSDDELARSLSLSVGTIQKAMALLQQDALVERRQGAGTFVTDPSADMRDVWHFRFLGADGTFSPLRAEALFRKVVQKRGPWSDYMNQAERYLKVRRIIEVDDAFSFLSDFYFDGDRFAALADEPLQTVAEPDRKPARARASGRRPRHRQADGRRAGFPDPRSCQGSGDRGDEAQRDQIHADQRHPGDAPGRTTQTQAR